MGSILEALALRARQYSDEVANLGRHQKFGQAFLDALAEVDRRRALCDETREELQRYLDVSSAQRAPHPRNIAFEPSRQGGDGR